MLASELIVGTAAGLQLPRSGTTRLEGKRVNGVHVDPGGVWALVEDRDLYRVERDDERLVARLPASGRGTCVTSHASRAWVGGEEVGLWRLDGSTLEAVASFEHAPSREAWSTPWGGPPAIFSMAAHGEDLYVGVHVGGILRTSDGGRSWAPTVDIDVDVHQVAVDGHGAVWAATGKRGLAGSTDRGETWQFLTDGLHGTYLLAVALTRDGALVGASSGHADRHGALQRLDGGRFTSVVGLPEDLGGAIGIRHLAARGDEAAVALPNGAVHVSRDGGRSWALLAEGLPDVAEVALGPAGVLGRP